MTTKLQEYVLRLSSLKRKERIAGQDIDLRTQEIISTSRSHAVLLKLMNNPKLDPMVRDSFVSRLEHFDVLSYVTDKNTQERKQGQPDLLKLIARLSSSPALYMMEADRIGNAIVKIDREAQLHILENVCGSDIERRLSGMKDQVRIIANNLMDNGTISLSPGLQLASDHFKSGELSEEDYQ